ncbi:hypothetical protein, partial [Cytobacillus praedii]|uniref:hypothetical protein n=1 Tax=Cytobacillus praedii TaxID=1742358 RepID=UPI0013F48FCC
YFCEIVSSLSIDDLSILGVLNDNEAEIKFKAIPKVIVLEESKLTDANFRKSLYRLEIAKFIEIIKDHKSHSLIITPFGQKALFTSLSKEGI